MFRAKSACFPIYGQGSRLRDSEIFRKRFIDMYAIIKTGGKQYRVSEGDVVYIEKLNVQPEETVNFNEVVAVGKEDGMVIGTPVVEGATVVAKAVKNGKGKKIHVFTYRSKKDSKRKLGHRQPYTKVEIVSINA